MMFTKTGFWLVVLSVLVQTHGLRLGNLVAPLVGNVVNDQLVDNVVNDQVVDKVVNQNVVEDVVNNQVVDNVLNNAVVNDAVNDLAVGNVVNDVVRDQVIDSYLVNNLVGDEIANDLLKDQVVNNLVNTKVVGDIVNDEVVDDLINEDIVGDLFNNEIVNDVLNEDVVDDLVRKEVVDNLVDQKIANDLLDASFEDIPDVLENIINENVKDAILNDEIVDDIINQEVVKDIINEEVVDDILNKEIVDDILNEDVVDGIVNDVVRNQVLENDVVKDIVGEEFVEEVLQEQVIDDLVNNRVVDNIVNQQVVDELINEDVVDNLFNKEIVEDLVNTNVVDDLVNKAVIEELVNEKIIDGILRGDLKDLPQVVDEIVNENVDDILNEKVVDGILNKEVANDVLNDRIVDDIVNDKVVDDIVNTEVVEGIINGFVRDKALNNELVTDLLGEHFVNDVLKEKVINDLVNDKVVDNLVNKKVADELLNDVIVDSLINDKVISNIVNDQVVDDLINKKVIEEIVNDKVIDGILKGDIVGGVLNGEVVNGVFNGKILNGKCLCSLLGGVLHGNIVEGVVKGVVVDGVLKGNIINGVLKGNVVGGILGGKILDNVILNGKLLNGVLNGGALTNLVNGKIVNGVLNGGLTSGLLTKNLVTDLLLNNPVVRSIITDLVVSSVLNGNIANGLLNGEVVNGVLNGKILKGDLVANVLGGVLRGNIIGGLVKGTIVNGVLHGNIVNGILKGKIVGGVLDGTLLNNIVLNGNLVDTILGIGGAAIPKTGKIVQGVLNGKLTKGLLTNNIVTGLLNANTITGIVKGLLTASGQTGNGKLQEALKGTYLALSPTIIRPGLKFVSKVTFLKTFPALKLTATIISRKLAFTLSRAIDVAQGAKSALVALDLPLDLGVSDDFKIVITALDTTGKLLIKDTARLTLVNKDLAVFIQTDKEFYRAGEQVRFRVATTDPNLAVFKGNLDIDIFDPEGIRIKQFLNAKTLLGVFTGSLKLADLTSPGDWTIQVRARGRIQERRVFRVFASELDKIDVNLSLPQYSLLTDQVLFGTLTVRYRNSRPVIGTATIFISQKVPVVGGTARGYRVTIPINGVEHLKIDLQQVLAQLGVKTATVLEVVAEVTETVTNKVVRTVRTLPVFLVKQKLSFLGGLTHFKPGLKLIGTALLSDPLGKPLDTLTNTVLTLKAILTPVAGTAKKILGPLKIPVAVGGIAPFSLDIPLGIGKVELLVFNEEAAAKVSLLPSVTTANGNIQAELNTRKLVAGALADFNIRSTIADIDVIYLLIADGRLFASDRVTLVGKERSIRIKLPQEIGPVARFVVFHVTKTAAIIADSIVFNVLNVVKNTVDIKFSEATVNPGGLVTVTVKTNPNSLCSVLAVEGDRFNLNLEKGLTLTRVLDNLLLYGGGLPGPCGPGLAPCLGAVVSKTLQGLDVQEIFQKSGLSLLTDALPFAARSVVDKLPIVSPLAELGVLNMPLGNSANSLLSSAAVNAVDPLLGSRNPVSRTIGQLDDLLRDSWLFFNSMSDDKGTCILNVTVPNKQTSWTATAFAMNEKTGLGIARKPSTLRVAKNVLVTLNLPELVTRGEQVILRATVTNVFDEPLKATVTLDRSDRFEAITIRVENGKQVLTFAKRSVTKILTIPARGQKIINFPIRVLDIGNIDVIVKAKASQAEDTTRGKLVVKAEGIPESYSISSLVQISPRENFRLNQKITFPDNVIAGTKAIVLSTTGNLIGQTLESLTNQLGLTKSGSGEDNLVQFVPTVLAIDYLKTLNKLLPEDLAIAKRALIEGYQLQIAFRHLDGSFSLFGAADGHGSTRLTSFVLKSLAHAKEHIFIDDLVLTKAIDWLLNRVDLDLGLFREMDSKSEGSRYRLSAFALISLIEAHGKGCKPSNPSLLEKALVAVTSTLEHAVDKITDVYDLSIISHALALRGSGKLDHVLEKLAHTASHLDDLLFWETEGGDRLDLGWIPPVVQAKARSIEATAYALLAHIAKGDLTNGLRVFKWLVRQRRANGGFGSTQATVVALQAMYRFAAVVHSTGSDLTIHVTAGNGDFSRSFTINGKNLLQVKNILLPSPDKVNVLRITATGRGSALLNIGVNFNVKVQEGKSRFSLRVVYQDVTSDGFRLNARIRNLKRTVAGLTVLRIALPSGFEPRRIILSKHGLLKRIQRTADAVLLFLDGLDHVEESISLLLERSGLVYGLQEAVCSIFDYLDTEDRSSILYLPNLLHQSSVCDSEEMDVEDESEVEEAGEEGEVRLDDEPSEGETDEKWYWRMDH